MPLEIHTSSSAELQQWIGAARIGSLFLTADETLYVMTWYGHRIVLEPVKAALLSRERVIREKIQRNQSVIRVSVVLNLVLLVAVVVLLLV